MTATRKKPGPKAKPPVPCVFPDCERRRESKGYCASHAAQLRRSGVVKPLAVWNYDGMECDFQACSRRPVANRLCVTHSAMLRSGTELRPIRSVRGRGATTVRDSDGNKQCITCSEWLAEGEFYASPQTRDALGVHCKECMKWGNAMRLFGITAERYAQMLLGQGGGCAICHTPPPANRRLSIDHDHACCPHHGRSCGECVRGLLCSNCNALIGFANDSTEVLAGAIQYLGGVR